MNKKPAVSLKHPTVRDVVDVSLSRFRQNAIPLLLIGAAGGIAIFILTMFPAGNLVYFIAFWLIKMIVDMASTALMICYLYGKDKTAGFTLEKIIPMLINRFPALFMTALLLNFIVISGFILLLIPGIIAIVLLSQTYFVVLFEGKSGWQALKASIDLTAGRRFLILKLFIIEAILNFLIVYILRQVPMLKLTYINPLLAVFPTTLITCVDYTVYTVLKNRSS